MILFDTFYISLNYVNLYEIYFDKTELLFRYEKLQ